jgi:hypothetical protein
VRSWRAIPSHPRSEDSLILCTVLSFFFVSHFNVEWFFRLSFAPGLLFCEVFANHLVECPFLWLIWHVFIIVFSPGIIRRESIEVILNTFSMHHVTVRCPVGLPEVVSTLFFCKGIHQVILFFVRSILWDCILLLSTLSLVSCYLLVIFYWSFIAHMLAYAFYHSRSFLFLPVYLFLTLWTQIPVFFIYIRWRLSHYFLLHILCCINFFCFNFFPPCICAQIALST